MSEYRFVDHTEVPNRVSQITNLSLSAFAELEAVPAFDEPYTEWYLQRPGCTPERCVGALYGDTLVSMALVTVQSVRIGDRLLECGIIDTMGTHRQHRRQGLATRLMEMAHEKMRDQGVDLSLLYTDPRTYAYELYQDIGYQPRGYCRWMHGDRVEAEAGLSAREATTDEYDRIMHTLNEFYSDYEGYSPLDDELWEWRKAERTRETEVRVMVAEKNGEIAATCTTHLALELQAQPYPPMTIADFAYDEDLCEPSEAMISMIPAMTLDKFVCIFDALDPLCWVFGRLGFEKTMSQTSMVLPFTDDARDAVAVNGGPWYPMIESIIGM